MNIGDRSARTQNLRNKHFICLIILLAACGAAPRAEFFTEDFSTLAHCDTVNTTACWDTGCGTLHLYPYAPQAESAIEVPECAFSFARSGDLVFIGEIDIGIRVIDISNIHEMHYLDGFLYVADPMDLEVDGDRLFVAAQTRLLIVDISDPGQLVILGETSEVSQVNDVAVSGTTAFLTSCSGGLYCVDISDPAAPRLIGQASTPSCAQNLALHGDHAYVCTGYLGFSVFDISDPAAPVHVNQLPGSYHPQRIRVAGDLAYVAEISGELLIYSLADPAAPTLVGACDLPGHAQDVAVTGKLAYITVGDPNLSAFCVVDAGDPAQPRLVNQVGIPGFPIQLDLFGEFALVNGFCQLLAVRIADPVPPSMEAEAALQPSVNDLVIAGDRVYALGYDQGEQVFLTYSLENPAAPEILGSLPVSSHPLGLALDLPFAYLGTYQSGLDVLDVSDPAAPIVIASTDLDRSGVEAVPYGDFLFLGYVDGGPGGTGLSTLDVSDPAHPVLLNDLPLEYSPREMVRHGTWLFTLQWEDGQKDGRAEGRERQSDIAVIDISNPVDPQIAATFSVPDAYVEFLHVDGDLLYASFWSFEDWYGNGFVIYDISDPLAPVFLSRFEGGDSMGQLALAGDLAFQGGGHQIDVLDVSKPAAPTLLHSLTTTRENIWLGAAGDYLYCGGGYYGLRAVRVFDRSADALHNVAQSAILPAVQTPLSHVRMEAQATPSVLWDFSADGGAHWQALPGPGQWLPLAHPGTEPRWRASLLYTEIGAPPVVDNLTLEWISDPTAAGEGLPGAFDLRPPAPNPFNPWTTLSFELPEAGRARITILDISGRQVRRLLDAALPAGPHDSRWNGCDDAGSELPSGIYVCRLEGGGRQATRKLALIR